MSLRDRVKRLEAERKARERAEGPSIYVCDKNCEDCRIEPGQRWCEAPDDASRIVLIVDM